MKKLTYILLFIWNIGIGQTDSNPSFKYDTVKAVFLISDTGTYTIEIDTRVPAITLEFREKETYTRQDKSNWIYGYVIIQSEFTMISCPDGRIGCDVAHYGYGNKKTIGYLDLSKKPFSKDYIVWDYKIIE